LVEEARYVFFQLVSPLSGPLWDKAVNEEIRQPVKRMAVKIKDFCNLAFICVFLSGIKIGVHLPPAGFFG
jgi:hypothetical protein